MTKPAKVATPAASELIGTGGGGGEGDLATVDRFRGVVGRHHNGERVREVGVDDRRLRSPGFGAESESLGLEGADVLRAAEDGLAALIGASAGAGIDGGAAG